MTGVGRLVDDPELRFTSSGKAVARVRLAFSSRKKNPTTNEWEDGDKFFVDGTVWDQEAENVAESLTKGTEVHVTGRLKQRQYETREGEKRTAIDLQVDSIGPTLKYATAKVQKMQRSSGGAQGRANPGVPGDGDPWSVAAAPVNAGSFADDQPPF
jgi:single-strand DNA-binding protein